MDFEFNPKLLEKPSQKDSSFVTNVILQLVIENEIRSKNLILELKLQWPLTFCHSDEFVINPSLDKDGDNFRICITTLTKGDKYYLVINNKKNDSLHEKV